MKLEAKAALSIPYEVPASGIMQVRVAASESINVFAIRREALEQYRKKTEFPAYGVSSVAKEHQFLVQMPPKSPWNLIIENPWDREVEVSYAVVEMATANNPLAGPDLTTDFRFRRPTLYPPRCVPSWRKPSCPLEEARAGTDTKPSEPSWFARRAFWVR